MATISDSLRTKRLGDAVITTGLLHNLLGTYLYRRQLAGMASDRVIGSASDARLGTVDGERRQTALWFFVGGMALVTMGASIRRAGRDDERIAAALGPGMTAIGALGAATMPFSGFWLVIAEGIATTVLRGQNGRRTTL
jgi:Family of unknown function (DUF6463)